MTTRPLRPLSRIPARARLSAAAILLPLPLLACGGPAPAAGDVRTGPADGEAIEVVTTDNEFQPGVLELESGTEVTLEVINEGGAAHNLVIEELDLSTGTIEGGDTVTATFTVPEDGVAFVCTFHPNMTGEIQPTGA